MPKDHVQRSSSHNKPYAVKKGFRPRSTSSVPTKRDTPRSHSSPRSKRACRDSPTPEASEEELKDYSEEERTASEAEQTSDTSDSEEYDERRRKPRRSHSVKREGHSHKKLPKKKMVKYVAKLCSNCPAQKVSLE